MRRVWIVDDTIPFQNLPYDPPYVENEGIRHLLQDEADWSEPPVRLLCEGFCTGDFELRAISSPQQFLIQLERVSAPPHVIIFDWQGPGFSSEGNTVAIERALEKGFSYVQVYTHLGAAAPEESLTALRGRFPNRLLATRSKAEVDAQYLKRVIEAEWNGTIAGSLADDVRTRVSSAVERLLIELCSVPQSSLAALTGGDVDDFLAVALAMVKDGLSNSGAEFFAKIVEGAGAADSTEDLRRLLSIFYYSFPTDDVVRNGDIVRDHLGRFCLVVTPACDLERFQRKTGGFLTLVGGCLLEKDNLKVEDIVLKKVGPSATANHEGGPVVILPNLPLEVGRRVPMTDLALFTHSWNTLRVRKVEGALTYKSIPRLRRVCTLSDTFSNAVATHLVKAMASLGVPDFPGFEVTRMRESLGLKS